MNEKQVKTILSVRPADTKALPSYEYLAQLTINQATKIYMLEHNWNELKSWLEGNIKLLDDVYLGENKNNYSEDMILDMNSRKWGYKNTLDKMKWLEEGGNNESKK